MAVVMLCILQIVIGVDVIFYGTSIKFISILLWPNSDWTEIENGNNMNPGK